MRTAVFYTDLHPLAAKAAAAYAPQAELIETPLADRYAYWRELSARWGTGGGLLVIEQDIEIGPGTVTSLDGCPQDWCCYAYDIFSASVSLHLGLGCTRFSAHAQQVAGIPAITAEFGDCADCQGTCRGCWNHLDLTIARTLIKAGMRPHVHGEVPHHHDYGPAGILRGGVTTRYSWSPETGPVYLRSDPGPKKIWGASGVHAGR